MWKHARLAAIGLSIGILMMTALACGGGTGAPSGAIGAETTPPAPLSFQTDNETCGACHISIYEEWKSSRHAQAWTSETFRILSENYTREDCLACHAPGLILETGIANRPELRPDVRELGVTCITCHQDATAKKWKMHGPYEVDSPGHDSVQNAAFSTAEICASCHGQEDEFDQFTSWKAGPYGQSGFPCQTCHMTQTERRLADENMAKPVRWVGDHSFPGAYDEEFLKTAAEVTLAIEGGEVVARVHNQAGHLFPGAAHRTAILTVSANGETIGQTRISYEDGNRIPSDTVAEYRYPLPEGTAGTLEARLTFHRIVPNDAGDGVVEEPEGVLIATASVSPSP